MTNVTHKFHSIEMNLCITLVIYQESLHDARSTKYKISRPVGLDLGYLCHFDA
jgi:hypothetical protein